MKPGKYLVNACLLSIIFLTAGFNPVNRNEQVSHKGETIKIGLLIQDEKANAAFNGASLAVKLENENGGAGGRKFELVVKSMEGPWGAGSKQAVSLIFEDKVWALFGVHDGRNAHLVEQASAKSGVVFMSAWSGDETLAEAFIPWFFNFAPTDIQQAEALYNEIFLRRKARNILIIAENKYDPNQAFKTFSKIAGINNIALPLKIRYEDYSDNLSALAELVKSTMKDCVLLFCSPVTTSRIIEFFRSSQVNGPFFSPLLILNENELSQKQLESLSGMIHVPSFIKSGRNFSTFDEGYRKSFGRPPGAVAAYAFDGMNVLIGAIKKAGVPDREKIQQSLSETELEGITGNISFSSNGTRKGVLAVFPVSGGLPFEFISNR
jgi:branched-chain amino acid transport system substrate-binding protein